MLSPPSLSVSGNQPRISTNMLAMAILATVLAMLIGYLCLVALRSRARRTPHGAIELAPSTQTLTHLAIHSAHLTFPVKLGGASKWAGQLAARFLAKRNVHDLHLLSSDDEIKLLPQLLRLNGIFELYGMDVETLVEIHLEVHKETRAAMVAHAKRNLAGTTGAHEADLEYPMSIASDVVAETMAAETDQEMAPRMEQPPAQYPGGVAASPNEQSTGSATKRASIDHAPVKNPPEGTPIADGQPVTHKPRTMSQAVDRGKLLVGVDPEGKPSYVPGWAVKHVAARARGISSGVLGTAASSGHASECLSPERPDISDDNDD